jgi:hypothetical protein
MGLFSGITDAVGGLFEPDQQHIGTDELYPDWMQGDVRDVASNIPYLETPRYYGGETVASIDPWYGNNLGNMAQFGMAGTGLGHNFMMRMQEDGKSALDSIGQGMDYMGQMQDRGANRFGLDLGTGAQIAQFLAPGVQNMFDVNARDIQQGYDFNVLPGLNMASGMAGGYGGTKALQQSALGQAQTAGNIQNMGTQLWQNAANQAVQGAMQGGMQNLASANAFDQNMMSNYGRYGALGANMLNNANQMGISNMNASLGAGREYQDYLQSRLDANVDRWNFNEQAPWLDQQQRQALTQSWVNPGAIQYGASPFQNILDAGQMIAGFAGGMPLGGGGGGGGYGMTQYGTPQMPQGGWGISSF